MKKIFGAILTISLLVPVANASETIIFNGEKAGDRTEVVLDKTDFLRATSLEITTNFPQEIVLCDKDNKCSPKRTSVIVNISMTQANGPQKEGHQAMKVSSTLTQTITGKTRGSSGVGECVNTYGGPNFKKKTCNYSLSRIVAPGVTKTVQNMITMIERDGRKMLVINGESSTKWNRFKRAQ